jgi:hypothetical protein
MFDDYLNDELPVRRFVCSATELIEAPKVLAKVESIERRPDGLLLCTLRSNYEDLSS